MDYVQLTSKEERNDFLTDKYNDRMKRHNGIVIASHFDKKNGIICPFEWGTKTVKFFYNESQVTFIYFF